MPNNKELYKIAKEIREIKSQLSRIARLDPFEDSNLTYPDGNPMTWAKLAKSVDFQAGPYFYARVDEMNPYASNGYPLDKITSATVYVEHSGGETTFDSYKRGQFPKFVSQWRKKDPNWEVHDISINWYGEFSEARALLTPRRMFMENAPKLLKSSLFEWVSGGLEEPNDKLIDENLAQAKMYIDNMVDTEESNETWGFVKNLADIMRGAMQAPISADIFLEEIEPYFDDRYEYLEAKEDEY